MKTLVQIACVAFIFSALTACSTKPEAIAFGDDHCHFCKMTIVDEKFGAELVTEKGKVYKFDDMRCLLNYYSSGYESREVFKHLLVIDFANQGNLIDATSALYLKSPDIRSPMDGQVAAFQSKPAMEDANKQWNGTYLTWDELSTQSR